MRQNKVAGRPTREVALAPPCDLAHRPKIVRKNFWSRVARGAGSASILVFGGVWALRAAHLSDGATSWRPSFPRHHHPLKARDPEAFLRHHVAPALVRGRVALTREEAVIQELVSRSATLLPSQARLTGATLCAEARLAGYDPLLILALMRVESVYNHLALSQAGAEGLMQLMPTTARALLARDEAPAILSHTFDPVVNVRLGIRYLAELDKRFGHRLEVALTAYNRGPKATQYLLRRRLELPPYVRAAYSDKVLEQYGILRAQYGRLPLARHRLSTT